jgi:hypothetical protein
MPNTHGVAEQPPTDYDPEVRERIHLLLEKMRAAVDADQLRRLEDELDEVIFGSRLNAED